MTLKALALVALLSFVATTQANAAGFYRHNYNSYSWSWSGLTQFWSSLGSLFDGYKDGKYSGGHDYYKRDSWKDRYCEPKPPKCAPEPGSALAGLVAVAGLATMLRRRK